MGNSIITQPLRSRTSALPPKHRARPATDDTPRVASSVLAELVWTALPAALAEALVIPLAKIWVDPTDQQGRFGMTILRDDSTGAPLSLNAWVLVCQADDQDAPNDSPTGVIRQPLFEYAAKVTTGATADFALFNGRSDRLSLDITDATGQALCRLSYLIPSGGKAVWWGSAILPERLGLAGGRYELLEVHVDCLTPGTS